MYIWPADKRLRDQNGRHGALHVKCAVADQRVLFLSSANLTDHALSLNMELGVLIRGGDAAPAVWRHFQRMIEQGELVKLT